ncbi:hypothetical protein E5163_12090 [Marinicauda algicola]|uniref:UrcA family protein n=1 Tax=Marinicauda algicola TaxID=2029849 RepID=A0A4S2GZG2_9PROT|nr:hypothetical protein [Marinicauda algicola]TGY88546.1 hypothetical protein E5163_12090 [Marinicauda algicola]
MLFILRAAFWISVVAAFTPPQFHMSEDSPLTGLILAAVDEPGHDAIGEVISASQETRSDFCRQYAEVCAVGEQAGSFAGFLGDVAVARVESWAAAQGADTRG